MILSVSPILTICTGPPSARCAAWKESIQRYGANAMRNVAETRRKLLSGESVQNGFVEFTLRERGKTRHIKSVHISERVVQKSLCDNALVPLLSNTLIHDNGASIKGKGVHFALCRLVCHLSRYCRRNRTNEEPQGKPCGIEDFSLKSLRMRGNKSPAPPV
jgi:hypothetical protein